MVYMPVFGLVSFNYIRPDLQLSCQVSKLYNWFPRDLPAVLHFIGVKVDSGSHQMLYYNYLTIGPSTDNAQDGIDLKHHLFQVEMRSSTYAVF